MKILLACTGLIFLVGCSKVKQNCETALTYDGEIRSIIETSCNNESCHIGEFGGWEVLDDFSSYSKLLPYLESNSVSIRINSNESPGKMPPKSWPERELSESDLSKLNDWISRGFPENCNN